MHVLPVEPQIRGRAEQALGTRFDRTRIHTDAESAERAKSLGARAYSVGEDIHFARGAYDPVSTEGRSLIAHELVHVAQSKGRDAQMDAPRASDAAEREAEALANPVLAGRPVAVRERSSGLARQAAGTTPQPAPTPTPTAPVSMEVNDTVSETMVGPAGRPEYNFSTSWPSRYALTIDPTRHVAIVTLRLFSVADENQRNRWGEAVRSKWSDKFALVVASEERGGQAQQYPIFVNVIWTSSAASAHRVITANAPNSSIPTTAVGGTANMDTWGTGDTGDVGHEAGHMFGNRDEYFQVNGVDYHGYRNAEGVMNDPSQDPLPRHYESIRRHAAELLRVADGRVTVARMGGANVGLILGILGAVIGAAGLIGGLAAGLPALAIAGGILLGVGLVAALASA